MKFIDKRRVDQLFSITDLVQGDIFTINVQRPSSCYMVLDIDKYVNLENGKTLPLTQVKSLALLKINPSILVEE